MQLHFWGGTFAWGVAFACIQLQVLIEAVGRSVGVAAA